MTVYRAYECIDCGLPLSRHAVTNNEGKPRVDLICPECGGGIVGNVDNVGDNPIYAEAREHWIEVQAQQIKKGLAKYPTPLNPDDWTAEQLLEHIVQENVDQMHYALCLFKKIGKPDKAEFKKEERRPLHYAELMDELAKVTQELESLSNAHAALYREKEDAQEVISEYERNGLKYGVDSLRKQIEQKQERIEYLEIERNGIMEAVEGLVEERAKLQRSVQGYRGRIEMLDNDYDAMRANLKALEAERDKLKKFHEEYSEASAIEQIRLMDELKDVKAALQLTHERNEMLNKSLGQLMDDYRQNNPKYLKSLADAAHYKGSRDMWRNEARELRQKNEELREKIRDASWDAITRVDNPSKRGAWD